MMKRLTILFPPVFLTFRAWRMEGNAANNHEKADPRRVVLSLSL